MAENERTADRCEPKLHNAPPEVRALGRIMYRTYKRLFEVAFEPDRTELDDLRDRIESDKERHDGQ